MDAKFCIVSHCTKLNACAVGALFIRMISIYYSEGFFSEPPPTFLQVAYYLSQAGKGREKTQAGHGIFKKKYDLRMLIGDLMSLKPKACALVYLLMAIWLSMHASIKSHSYATRLLTRWGWFGWEEKMPVFFFYLMAINAISILFFKVKSWSSVLFAFRKLKICLGKKQDLILPGLCDFQFLVAVKSTFWMHAMRILKGKVDRCYEFHFGKAGMNVERVEARLLSDVSFIPWIWINCHSL